VADDLDRDEAALAAIARHALHDEELIAAFAVGASESEDDAVRAQSLIDRCTTCRDLHADLVALTAAVKHDARGRLAAPRDFRLSVEDAQRLGGRVSPRGFLARLRRSLDSFGRPIGASLATLGLVGVLVGSLSFGGAAGALPQTMGSTAATNAPGAEVDGQTDTAKATDVTAALGPAASQRDTRTNAEGAPGILRSDGPPNPSALLVGGSLLMLFAGLALLLVTFRRGRRNR